MGVDGGDLQVVIDDVDVIVESCLITNCYTWFISRTTYICI